MTVADTERRHFGEALEPADRAVAGVAVAAGAVGHAALAAAAVTFFYVIALTL